VAVEAVLADENVDAVVVNFTPQMNTDPIRTAEVLVGLRAKSNKPILPVWMGEIGRAHV
jgi:acyl-CoA synthetase (NDP forming)